VGDSRDWERFWGWEMATVATRAPKRELAPDWREALADAVRRFAVRTWGVATVLLSIAAAVALATHNPTDPSLSTAAGGPPTNWMGSIGAYFSDALLLLFGIGSALFVPVTAMAGLRIATVSTVALVTVAAVVSFGGFGTVILNGFNANFYRPPIATGTICCVLLALLLDLMLIGLGRLVMPWTRRRVAS